MPCVSGDAATAAEFSAVSESLLLSPFLTTAPSLGRAISEMSFRSFALPSNPMPNEAKMYVRTNISAPKSTGSNENEIGLLRFNTVTTIRGTVISDIKTAAEKP